MSPRALVRLVLSVVATAGCGRTMVYFPPPPPTCGLQFAPARLDFGSVPGGTRVTQTVTVTDTGQADCHLTALAIADGGDPGFGVTSGSLTDATALTVTPGSSADLQVDFAPNASETPGAKQATLAFASDAPLLPRARVPLSASIPKGCALTAAPVPVDFGLVPLFTTQRETVQITSAGDQPCTITSAALAPQGDPLFSLASVPAFPTALAPGASLSLTLAFSAATADPPHARAGAREVGRAPQPTLAVPRAAETPLGCALSYAPALPFGLVGLNLARTENAAITNVGTLPCTVSNLQLAPGTDPLFSYAAPPGSVQIAAGATFDAAVTFTAGVSTMPFLHTGNLTFTSSDPANATGSIALSATVDSKCVEASQWIYTVDTSATLSRFDPTTLTFTPIGTLNCNDTAGTFSMAVDQNAVAWVEYIDGQLFQVDTTNANCQPSGFQVGQHGIKEFGMGFVYDPTTGADTLYVAGGPTYNPPLTTTSTLATIAFPSLVLTPGPQLAFDPELAGTGDGQLWGYAFGLTSSTGVSTLAQIDPTTGSFLQRYTYQPLDVGRTPNVAMKFWGGSFWIFLGTSVFQVDRNHPNTVITALGGTAPAVVGAGVSTCAPVG